jgi:hypothetical protein
MTFTRRSFIQNLGVATFAAVSLNSAGDIFGQTAKSTHLFTPPVESLNDPLSYWSSTHFQSLVNTPLRVYKNKKSYVKLQIVEVKELKRAANESRGYFGESFSILLQASAMTKLSQNLYTVSHDNLGEFSLFIAPVGTKVNQFEAIINRISR